MVVDRPREDDVAITVCSLFTLEVCLVYQVYLVIMNEEVIRFFLTNYSVLYNF